MAEEQGPGLGGAFALALTEFAEKAGARADEAMREVVLEVFSRIISRSTDVVDKGRFRANWQYGLGAVPASVLEVAGTSEAPAPPAAPPTLAPGTGTGTVHFIVNNLPYARRLEYGYSAKGSKMVRTTIADFAGIVDGAAEKVRGT